MYMIQSMPTQHFRNPFLKLLETLVTTRSIYLQEEKNPTSINAVMANCSVMCRGVFSSTVIHLLGALIVIASSLESFRRQCSLQRIGSNDQYHCFAIRYSNYYQLKPLAQ